MISSLNNWLLNSGLWNFHKFICVPLFHLLLMSNFIPLHSLKIFCMTHIFLNLLRLNLLSILENISCSLEKKHAFCCSIVFCMCLIDVVALLFGLSSLYPYLFSIWLFYPLLKVIEINNNFKMVCFPLQFY